MKKVFSSIVSFIRKEWFLMTMLVIISVIITLFEMLN